MSIGGGGQLQALQQEMQALAERQEELDEEIESLRAEKREIDDAIEGLDVLESGQTVHVPLGGDAFVRATIEDADEIVVSLGANFAATEDREEAADTLETKQVRLDERIEELREEQSQLDEQESQLEQEAQQAQQQMLQQQAQQQGE